MTSEHGKARDNMVQRQLRPAGVRDLDILRAFTDVPREMFVPPGRKTTAYNDSHISLGNGRVLPAPAPHARMIEAAAPGPDDTVLDIGGAAGYSAAIWSFLVTTVIALEDDAGLYRETAERNWQALDACNIAFIQGALNKGCPEHAPYDIIFLNGAASAPPESLLAQLAPGSGRLLTIIAEPERHTGTAMQFRRGESGHISAWPLFEIAAPYLPGFDAAPAFTFDGLRLSGARAFSPGPDTESA